MKSYKLLQETIYGKTSIDDLSNNDLRERLKDHYTHDENEGHHLHEYSYNSSDINDRLHQRYANKRSKDYHPFSESIGELDKATTRHEAPVDFHVYTGLKSHPLDDFSSSYKTGRAKSKRILPAFTSATLNPQIAKKHALSPEEDVEEAHMMRIHIPKGSKHGTYIERHTKIDMSTKPEIHKITHDSGTTTKLHIWHAKIVE